MRSLAALLASWGDVAHWSIEVEFVWRCSGDKPVCGVHDWTSCAIDRVPFLQAGSNVADSVGRPLYFRTPDCSLDSLNIVVRDFRPLAENRARLRICEAKIHKAAYKAKEPATSIRFRSMSAAFRLMSTICPHLVRSFPPLRGSFIRSSFLSLSLLDLDLMLDRRHNHAHARAGFFEYFECGQIDFHSIYQ